MAVDIRMNYLERDELGHPFGRDGVVASMDKYKIDTAVLVPNLAVMCDFREGNRQLLEAIKGDDRLYGYLVVNPNYPDESVDLMREMAANRKFVALALFGGASRPYPNLDDCDEIINSYRRFAKPVFLHTAHAEAVEAAKEMAAAFPTLQFIFGSMGGPDWKRALNLGKLINVHLETSGSFDVEKIEEAVEKVGAHKVLFGSDLPFSDPASEIALIRASNVPKDAMIKVFDQNAVKLFGLGPKSESE
jgi:hypothetical protein